MFDFAEARAHMVESQIRTNDVTDLPVVRAFRQVPREVFVPQKQKALSYGDAHIALDDDRVMLRPRDIAKMVQAAAVKPTDVVLDIACSRGYSTAILSKLAETVIGLEGDEAAVEKATEKLTDMGVENFAVVSGDLKAGASAHGPFNVIFVNGAVSSVPKAWREQLSTDGRIVCILQDGPIGRACVISRSGDVFGEKIIFDTSAPMLPGFEKQPEFVF